MREIKFRAWRRLQGKMVTYINSRYNADFWGMVEADPDAYVVMEFTGLLDKRGKEIFEGDVVKCEACPNTHDTVVKWKDAGFWMMDEQDNPHVPFEGYREVIGNIFENPELLTTN